VNISPPERILYETVFSAHRRFANALYQQSEKGSGHGAENYEGPTGPYRKLLAEAFSNHLEETKGHVSKIRGLLLSNEGDDSTETCKVIDGLTTEASDTIKDVTDPSVRDIALIGAAQHVEHHEIAIYGTLRRWAEIIGRASDVPILESIQEEEEKADELLTEIAGTVNMQAAA
jgi:ferritin-like metal-binding protein YciE